MDRRAMRNSSVNTKTKSKLFAKFDTVYRYPFVDEQVLYYGFGTDQFYSNPKLEEGWSTEADVEMNVL